MLTGVSRSICTRREVLQVEHTMNIAHGADILSAWHAPPVIAPVLVSQQVSHIRALSIEDGFSTAWSQYLHMPGEHFECRRFTRHVPLIDFGKRGVGEETDVNLRMASVQAGGLVSHVSGAGHISVI